MASSFEYQEARQWRAPTNRSIAGAEFESLQVFLSKDHSNNCLSHLWQLLNGDALYWKWKMWSAYIHNYLLFSPSVIKPRPQ